MPVKIGKTSDLLKNFHMKVLIYGEPKSGKTRLANTFKLKSDDRLLYVAVDPGQLSIRHRDFDKIERPDAGWSVAEFEETYNYIKDNSFRWDVVFVDGLDEIGEVALSEFERTNRDGRAAYGELGDFANQWVKKMRDLPNITVIFITHIDQMQDDRGALINKPKFPGKKVPDKMQGWFDLIGCLRAIPDGNGGNKYMIQFSKLVDPRYDVGDRSGVMNDFENPDMAAIMDKIQSSGISLQAPDDQDNVVTREDLVRFGTWVKEHQLKPEQIKSDVFDTYKIPIDQLTRRQLTAFKTTLEGSL